MHWRGPMGTSAYNSPAGWVPFAAGLVSAGTADLLATAGANGEPH